MNLHIIFFNTAVMHIQIYLTLTYKLLIIPNNIEKTDIVVFLIHIKIGTVRENNNYRVNIL